MIIKLIAAKARAHSAVRYAITLADYMADANRQRLRPDAIGADHGLMLSRYMTQPKAVEDVRERVLYKGARIAGENADWDTGVAEMERRLAKCSKRVKKPTRHVVVSYRAGEHPTEAQCAEAVAMLAQELGCDAAAVLWAAHSDTDNIHIHVLFVTVDPDTGAAIPFGVGRDGRAAHKEAMQRAIARIEHAQDLQAEVGGRYEVIDEHVVRRPDTQRPALRRAPLRQEILAWEAESGFASFTRTAQDLAGPVLDRARSWVELHQGLARHGIGIRPSGHGGELHAGAEHAKLSNIDRRHSWARLVKPDRLGPYEPPRKELPATFEPHVLDAERARSWLERQNRQRAVAARVDARIAGLTAARDATLADLKGNLAAQRADLAAFDGDPRLKRDLQAAWPALGIQAVTAITAGFAARIAAVRGLRGAIAVEDDLDDVDIDALGAADVGIALPWIAVGAPSPAPLPGFAVERSGDVVRYWAADDRQRLGQPALVDTGAIIWVNDRSDAAIAAALKLAKGRSEEAVGVFGDAAYLAQCRRVAAAQGIAISVITVREAQRRARKVDEARRRARTQAVNRIRADRPAPALAAWARAYTHARHNASLDDVEGDAASLGIETLPKIAADTPLSERPAAPPARDSRIVPDISRGR